MMIPSPTSRVIVLSSCLLACLATMGNAQSPPSTSQPKIVVTGTASVTTSPDLGTVVLRIEAKRDTAAAARQDAAVATNKTLSALVPSLVPAEDVQTIDINLSPNYVWQQATNTNLIKGYVFSQTLEVKVRNLTAETLSSVVDAAVAAGGNLLSIQSVSTDLSRTKRSQATNNARGLAVTDAKATATTLATAANVTLGQVLLIMDSNAPAPIPVPMPAMADSSAGTEMAKTPTPVSITDQEVVASVVMEFLIS